MPREAAPPIRSRLGSRWRALPLVGYGGDLLLFALLLIGSSVVATMLWTTWHASSQRDALESGPQRIFAIFEPCLAFDESAALAVLQREGKVDPPSLKTDAGNGTSSRENFLGSSDRGPAEASSSTTRGRQIVLHAIVEPPPRHRVEISASVLSAAAGCTTQDVAIFPNTPPAPESEEARRDRAIAVSTWIGIGALAFAAAATWFWRRRGWEAVSPRMSMHRALGLAAGAAIAVQSAFVAASTLLAQVGIVLVPSNLEPLSAILRSAPLAAALLIVVVVPIVEELFFRGLLLRRFARAGHPYIGLLMSCGLFAQMHQLAPTGATGPAWAALFVIYLSAGAVLGGLYLRTGRLGAAMLAHILLNAIGLALWVLHGDPGQSPAATSGPAESLYWFV